MEAGKRNGLSQKKQSLEVMRFVAASPAEITRASTRSVFRNIAYLCSLSLWRQRVRKSVQPPMLKSPPRISTARQTSARASIGKRLGRRRASLGLRKKALFESVSTLPPKSVRDLMLTARG